jgi:hypothetical protein
MKRGHLAVALGFALVAGFFAARSYTHADPPNISRYACEQDVDCVIVATLPSCDPCGGCPGNQSAVARRWLDAQSRACTRPRTRPATCTPCPSAQPSGDGVEAVCRERMCTMRSAPVPAR